MTTYVEDIRLEYLVTGFRNSGTRYMAELLTGAGVLCGHEFIFRMDGPKPSYEDDEQVWGGIPWWQMRADSSWPAAGYLDHPCLEDAVLIHLVRNPLAVIRSCAFIAGGHVPPDIPHAELASWVERWVTVNSAVEPAAHVRVRAEDRAAALAQIPGIDQVGVLPQYDNPDSNKHYLGPARELTVDMLPPGYFTDALIDLAGRYGYPL